MSGVPGTIAGGMPNPADQNFPAIGRANAGKASKEFEASRPGAKLKNLANADYLKGNTALKMMKRDYHEEIKGGDSLQDLE